MIKLRLELLSSSQEQLPQQDVADEEEVRTMRRRRSSRVPNYSSGSMWRMQQFHRGSVAVLLLLLLTIDSARGTTTTSNILASLDTLPILWRDEFDSTTSTTNTINEQYWTPRIGNGDNGWGNGELQIYTNNAANLGILLPDDNSNSVLGITVQRQDTMHSDGTIQRTFTSARIDTRDKVLTQYGRISARIQIPDTNAGLWPAFWTLGDNANGTLAWPATGEINIMEVGQGQAIDLGIVNRRVVSAAHWQQEDGSYATYAGWFNCDFDLSADYYVYTLDWNTTHITTYVNDIQVWIMDISSSSCTNCEEFHKPHYIILNMAVGGGFTSGGSSSSAAGCISTATSSSSGEGCGPLRTADNITAPLPATMKIDWVRIYDNSAGVTLTETPRSGYNPSPAPIVDSPVNFDSTTSAPIASESASPPVLSPVDFDSTTVSPMKSPVVQSPVDSPVNFDSTTSAPIASESASPPVHSPVDFDSTTLSPVQSPVMIDSPVNFDSTTSAPIASESASPPLASPVDFDSTTVSPMESPIDFDSTTPAPMTMTPTESPIDMDSISPPIPTSPVDLDSTTRSPTLPPVVICPPPPPVPDNIFYPPPPPPTPEILPSPPIGVDVIFPRPSTSGSSKKSSKGKGGKSGMGKGGGKSGKSGSGSRSGGKGSSKSGGKGSIANAQSSIETDYAAHSGASAGLAWATTAVAMSTVVLIAMLSSL